jgi:hypothetical protein
LRDRTLDVLVAACTCYEDCYMAAHQRVLVEAIISSALRLSEVQQLASFGKLAVGVNGAASMWREKAAACGIRRRRGAADCSGAEHCSGAGAACARALSVVDEQKKGSGQKASARMPPRTNEHSSGHFDASDERTRRDCRHAATLRWRCSSIQAAMRSPR